MPKYMIKSGAHYRKEGGKWERYVKDDVMEATEEDVKNILDKVEKIGPPEPKNPEAPEKQALKAVHKGGGKYDVINIESGKAINSKLLTKDEANELLDNP